MPCLLSWSPLSSHLFLPTGPTHRQGEVVKRNTRPPTKDGICTENGKMFSREQDAPPGINGETADLPAYATRKAQLASRVKEEQHALADLIALTRRPQANPLGDRNVLARRGATDRFFDVEHDRNRFKWLCAVAGVTFDLHDGSRKDYPRRACELRQAQ